MDIDELRSTLDDLAVEGRVSGRVTAAVVARTGARRRKTRRTTVALFVIVGMVGLGGAAAAVVGHSTGSPHAHIAVVGPAATTTTMGRPSTPTRYPDYTGLTRYLRANPVVPGERITESQVRQAYVIETLMCVSSPSRVVAHFPTNHKAQHDTVAVMRYVCGDTFVRSAIAAIPGLSAAERADLAKWVGALQP